MISFDFYFVVFWDFSTVSFVFPTVLWGFRCLGLSLQCINVRGAAAVRGLEAVRGAGKRFVHIYIAVLRCKI